MIKIWLRRKDGKIGTQEWETDKGLMMNQVDALTGCLIVGIEISPATKGKETLDE